MGIFISTYKYCGIVGPRTRTPVFVLNFKLIITLFDDFHSLPYFLPILSIIQESP